MDEIFFDVGANDGSTFLQSSVPVNRHIYAFEPTPHLIEVIKKRAKGIAHFHLIEAAVSDYNGEALFNVCGQRDWGCSSLLDFNTESFKHWSGGSLAAFNITDRIQVKVIRLDTFIEENKIPYITYFHCDAQGSDLKILMGMGDKIRLIESGVVEAANKLDVLYKGQNTVLEVTQYLEDNEFEITNVQSNDGSNNEANVYFTRK